MFLRNGTTSDNPRFSTGSKPSNDETQTTDSIIYGSPKPSKNKYMQKLQMLKNKRGGNRLNSLTSLNSNRSNMSVMSHASNFMRNKSVYFGNLLSRKSNPADELLKQYIPSLPSKNRPQVALVNSKKYAKKAAKRKRSGVKLEKKLKHIFVQNISPSATSTEKKYGQDALAIGSFKNMECIVLCDGHGFDGAYISQSIATVLSYSALEKCKELKRNTLTKHDVKDLFKVVEEKVVFANAASSDLEIGSAVFDKNSNYRPGTVVNFIEEAPQVTVVFEDGSRDILFEEDLVIERFNGGCTCIFFLTDKITNLSRLCYLGDSRLMILNDLDFVKEVEEEEDLSMLKTPKMNSKEMIKPRQSSVASMIMSIRKPKTELKRPDPEPVEEKQTKNTRMRKFQSSRVSLGPSTLLKMVPRRENRLASRSLARIVVENDEVLEKVYGMEDDVGFFSQVHNVYSSSEHARLKNYNMGNEDSIDRLTGRLVNGNTSIEPTKGFGDVKMRSVGYSSDPNTSSLFRLAHGNVVLGASDGLFDSSLWSDDEELLEFVAKLYDKNEYSQDVATNIGTALVAETMRRLESKPEVPPDDLAVFLFCVKS